MEGKKVNVKPNLKYKEGKLVVSGSLGVDTDQDGLNAVALELSIVIDAQEAVNEIVKDGAPQWIKDILSKVA